MADINEMTYDELSEHISESIKMLRRKSYGEGYEQGKFDARMEGGYYERPPSVDEMMELGRRVMGTPQEKRDRIVERAKGDVEEIKKRLGFEYVDFNVNKDKRTVVALIKDALWSVVKDRGIAKCAPNDCFNVHIGKAIALRRALGLEVPAEYLNAPQPTEVRVGDIIKGRSSATDGQYRVIKKHEDARYYDFEFLRTGEYYCNHFYRDLEKLTDIIDDSREGD